MSLLKPLVRRFLALYWRMSRGLTLGVRAIVLDGDRVLLVRHGYVEGWHLPGGGVEPGETAERAVVREVEEEAGIIVTGRCRLISVHHHAGLAGRDHVLVYQLPHWQRGPEPQPNREIVEIGWFALDQLPEATTASTRMRLLELGGLRDADERW